MRTWICEGHLVRSLSRQTVGVTLEVRKVTLHATSQVAMEDLGRVRNGLEVHPEAHRSWLREGVVRIGQVQYHPSLDCRALEA